jgi:hypothetical protein
MSLPTSMTANRLLILSLLVVSGAVVSATAASVFAAGDAARRLPPGSRVSGRIDPLTPARLAEAADPTRPPANRVQLLDAITTGACFSTREMIFGASRTRHAALDRALDAMTGMPNAPALRQQLHQRLDAFTDGPSLSAPLSAPLSEPVSAPVSASPDASGVAMLRWLLPRIIEARVDYCRTLR